MSAVVPARLERLPSPAANLVPHELVARGLRHPVRVSVPNTGLHLRPIRETDTALDYPAVMGSRERLWEIFGPAWSWPAETMSYEENRIDLLRHEKSHLPGRLHDQGRETHDPGANVTNLREDAEARGWDAEVARHSRVITNIIRHLA